MSSPFPPSSDSAAAAARWHGGTPAEASVGRARRVARAWVALLVLFAGLVYVGNAWSPSSYALALRYFEVRDTGLVAGTPQAVRADEWAVHTPLLQAAIRADRQRLNDSSYYREDLRSALTLPLADWAMAIKPLHWGYAFLPPATAFSLFWFAAMALFLLGYARLFAGAGAPPLHAALLSAILFASLYVQSFWTILAGPLALFPWVLLAAGWRAPLWAVGPVYAWVAASWLLSMFYPPLAIVLAAVAAAWLVALRPDLLRAPRLLVLAGGTVAAAAAVGWYLRDYLRANLTTLYPGQRTVGGGDAPLHDFVSQFFPSTFVALDYTPLRTDNVCLEASAGSLLAALVLCCLDWRALAARLRALDAPARLRALAPAVLLAVIWAWMYLPLPAWLGAPLLWNRVPGERMEFAAGLLLLALAYAAARSGGLVFSVPRALAWTVLAAGALAWGKGLGALAQPRSVAPELAAAALVWLLVALARWRPGWTARHGLTVALAGAALIGTLAYGRFNPIQSARPIFADEPTAVTRELDRLAAEARARGEGLGVPGFFGAVLNGRGYPSVAHVLLTPQLDTFARLFPDLPAAERERLFNRYAHVMIDPAIEQPRLVRFDAVAIPAARWSAQQLFPRPIGQPRAAQVDAAQPAGFVDRAARVTVGGRPMLRLEGWAAFARWTPDQALLVAVDGAAPGAEAVLRETRLRPDVAAAIGAQDARQGFVIDVPLASGATGTEVAGAGATDTGAVPRYCVLAAEPGRITRLTPHDHAADAAARCRALAAPASR